MEVPRSPVDRTNEEACQALRYRVIQVGWLFLLVLLFFIFVATWWVDVLAKRL